MLNVSTPNVKTNNGICKCKFSRFSLKLAFYSETENSLGIKTVEKVDSAIEKAMEKLDKLYNE